MPPSSQATAGSLPLEPAIRGVLKPEYRRKLTTSGVQEQARNEAEAQQLDDLLTSLAQANRQVTLRLDSIHQELQEMIAFSRAARLSKE